MSCSISGARISTRSLAFGIATEPEMPITFCAPCTAFSGERKIIVALCGRYAIQLH